jgi:hypothetical protein
VGRLKPAPTAVSRQLPSRPSLDHLKKQAKALLRELRRTRPDAELTDAQHSLALEYGFASWPKMKAYVDVAAAAPPPDPDPLFPRFTFKARQALFFARFEAGELGTRVIAAEHLLLGVMRASQPMRGHIFDGTTASIEQARQRIAPVALRETATPTSVEMPFTLHSKEVMVAAGREADALREARIGLVHLTIAAMQRSPIVAALLDGWSIRAGALRADSQRLLDAEPQG